MSIRENEVTRYYDSIAKTYDQSRFGNSYGRFIDAEERRILDRLMESGKPELRLEMACGTGRLTGYATHALDTGGEMLKIAGERHPSVEFRHASAEDTGYAAEMFDTVYTFHLLMHLEPEMIERIFMEAHRILKPGGRLIFDIPSRKRRAVSSRQKTDWHGGTGLSREEVIRMAKGFREGRRFGILFFPVHRLPGRVRRFFLKPDIALANGRLLDYSSYVVYELIKE